MERSGLLASLEDGGFLARQGAFAVETESRPSLQVPTAFISSPPLLKGLGPLPVTLT